MKIVTRFFALKAPDLFKQAYKSGAFNAKSRLRPTLHAVEPTGLLSNFFEEDLLGLAKLMKII